MAGNLALTIGISAAAGGALSVFNNLKGTIQRVAVAAKDLKAKQEALGLAIKNSAAHPWSKELREQNAQYEKQRQLIEHLHESKRKLVGIQGRIAANEAHRAALRGKIMETAAVGYIAAYPIRVSMEFESAMSKVQALTRLSKESEEMRALTAQARQLGAETMFSATDAAQAQGFLAMAGFNPQQIMQSMPAMLDMAKAGDIDLQRTADIASNIQTAYGLDASQMTRVADTLTMAFTTANVDLEMLAETMKYMGPVAKAAGMSLEESSAMAGMLGNAGIQASMAGTTLRNALTRLSAPPKGAAKALDLLKIKTKDARGNLRSMPEILYDIAKAMEGMGSAEKIALSTDIFGARAAPGMMAMLDNAEKIKPYIDVVKNSAGAAAKTAKIMGDNVAGALDEVTSAWEDFNIELMSSENQPLRELLLDIANLIRAVSDFARENKALVSGVLRVILGLIAMRGGLLLLSYAASLAFTPILHLFKVLRMVSATALVIRAGGLTAAFPVFARISGALSAIIRKLRLFGVVLWEIGKVFLRPFLWIGIALRAALGQVLVWLDKMIVASVVKIWRATSFAMGQIGRFLGWIGPILGKFLSAALNGLASLGGVLVKGARLAGHALLWLGRMLLLNPIGLALTAIAVAAFLIYRHWEPIKAFFTGLWQQVKTAFEGGTGEVIALVLRWLGNIGAAILDFSPLGLFYQAFAPVLNWFGADLPAKFSEFGGMIAQGLIDGITGMFGKLHETTRAWMDDTIENIQMKLGINSPSRVFMEIGGFAMQGLLQGINAGSAAPVDAVRKMAGSLAAASAITLSAPALAAPFAPPALTTIAPAIDALPAMPPALAAVSTAPAAPAPLAATPPLRPPSAAGTQASPPAPSRTTTINLTINPAPGMDEKALAELVVRKIREAERGVEVRARSRLSDAD